MNIKQHVILTGLLFIFIGCNKPDISELNIAINNSGKYLEDQIRENGMFEYRINMNPEVFVHDRYNILRHSGTIYSLCAYYNIAPNDSLKTKIELTGKYLLHDAIEEIKELDKNIKAVWSKPEVNNSGGAIQAKLGGTGLGLVALLSIEEISPGFNSMETLKALGNFILYMQKEDGSVYSKYIPSKGGRDDSWVSLYYPGEAALGLIMLYEKDGSEKWLESAGKILYYLSNKRQGQKTVPADHWALLATAKLFSIKNISLSPDEYALIRNHALQVCESILRTQISDNSTPELNGGFTRDGRTTPTSTRLEGLIAALSIFPASHVLVGSIKEAIEKGIKFLLNAQVKEGKYKGAIPKSVISTSNPSENVKEYDKSANEVRIDYVQHALSAMIMYKKFIVG